MNVASGDIVNGTSCSQTVASWLGAGRSQRAATRFQTDAMNEAKSVLTSAQYEQVMGKMSGLLISPGEECRSMSALINDCVFLLCAQKRKITKVDCVNRRVE